MSAPAIRRGPAVALTLAAAAALALAAPLAASAHVSLDSNQAEPGSYPLLTFKVPNESADASTTSLTLTLPADTPFTSVRTVPVPGWTARLVRTTLPAPVTIGDATVTEAVTSIVWTADADAAIGDGELGLFPVSLGPVPDVGQLALPVDQGYSDGTVVSWSGAADAEHPAPVLYVEDAPAGDHHDGTPEASDPPEVDAAPEESTTTGEPDVLARVLGIAGLAVGAVGIVLAVTARRPARRDQP